MKTALLATLFVVVSFVSPSIFAQETFSSGRGRLSGVATDCNRVVNLKQHVRGRESASSIPTSTVTILPSTPSSIPASTVTVLPTASSSIPTSTVTILSNRPVGEPNTGAIPGGQGEEAEVKENREINPDLIGTWRAVDRHDDGQLTVIELRIDGSGRAELTVTANGGQPSTERIKLEDLGQVIRVDGRQMVLAGAEGQVIFVRP